MSWRSSRSGGGRRSPPPGTPGSPLSNRSCPTANATEWIDHDPMTLVIRRREPRDQTKAIPYQDLEAALVTTRHQPAERKALWRMLYETAARAGEILALNVEDLDLSRRRAVIIGKGGHKEYVFWASGAARLSLPIFGLGDAEGRCSSPTGNPTSSPPGETNAHTLSRGRLSYERASTLFKQASGGWHPPPTPPFLANPPRRERSVHHPPPSQKPTPRPARTRHLHQTRKRRHRATHLRI